MNVTYRGQKPMWTLGDRLRKARELTEMDQTEFADAIGASRGTVSRYERGAVDIEGYKRPVLLAWAMASGVDLAWLITGDDPVTMWAEQTPVAATVT